MSLTNEVPHVGDDGRRPVEDDVTVDLQGATGVGCPLVRCARPRRAHHVQSPPASHKVMVGSDSHTAVAEEGQLE